MNHIRVVPDHPKPGINFYDIGTLLADPEAFSKTVTELEGKLKPHKPDLLVGIESRGFIVGVALAYKMSLPFIMIRKPGKLPGETVSEEYTLEYGTDMIEIQTGIIEGKTRPALIDDLLATGGTMGAAHKLVSKTIAPPVAAACLIELEGLNGRDKISCPLEILALCPA